MKEYENELYSRGIEYVAGVDEVGRGPLIGPVVTAAVILPVNYYNESINDSKKISEKNREKLYDIIMENAISVGIGIKDENVIDEVNILEATKLAMKEAISNLDIKPEHVLIDAVKLDLDIPSTSIIKGDTKSQSIAAASIIAKVTRDRMMIELDKKYPEYGFAKNKGYGTIVHLNALKQYGPIPGLHRYSYRPVKQALQEYNLKQKKLEK